MLLLAISLVGERGSRSFVNIPIIIFRHYREIQLFSFGDLAVEISAANCLLGNVEFPDVRRNNRNKSQHNDIDKVMSKKPVPQANKREPNCPVDLINEGGSRADVKEPRRDIGPDDAV